MYYHPLTPRERKVLELLAAGETNRGIAVKLGYAVTTVKGAVSSITSKLFVQNRVQAVAVAVKYGLIDPQIDQLALDTDVNYRRPLPKKGLMEVETGISPETPYQLPSLPWSELSDREIEVFSCFINGNLPNTVIEETLSISHSTLRGHLRSLYKKMEVDRQGLTELAKVYAIVKQSWIVIAAAHQFQYDEFVRLAGYTNIVHQSQKAQAKQSKADSGEVKEFPPSP